MNNCTFLNSSDKKHYKRVTKAQARKAYNNGLTVFLCPCNLRPFDTCGFYGFAVPVSIKNDFEIWTGNGSIICEPCDGFNKIVNEFQFYNCTNTETGKYTAFYIAID